MATTREFNEKYTIVKCDILVKVPRERIESITKELRHPVKGKVGIRECDGHLEVGTKWAMTYYGEMKSHAVLMIKDANCEYTDSAQKMSEELPIEYQGKSDGYHFFTGNKGEDGDIKPKDKDITKVVKETDDMSTYMMSNFI